MWISNAGNLANNVKVGTVSIQGGTLTNTNIFASNATVSMTGGILTNTSAGAFASGASMTLSGGTIINNNLGNIAVGAGSKLTLTSGTLQNSGYVGLQADLVTFAGANIETTATSNIGELAGTVTIAGSFTNFTSAQIGKNANNVILSSGTVVNNGVIALTSGTVQFNGGSITNLGDLAIGATTTLSGATIDNKNNMSNYPGSKLRLTSGTLQNSGVVGLQADLVAFNGANIITTTTSKIGESAAKVTLAGSFTNVASAEIGRSATQVIMSSGNILNQGNLAPSAVTFQLNGGSLTNSNSCGVGADQILIDGAEIFNDSNGNFGQNADQFEMISGTLTNNRFCAYLAGTLTISGGYLSNTSVINIAGGPVSISGGSVYNSSAYLGSGPGLNSKLTIGGNSWIDNAGSVYAKTIEITGGSITVRSGGGIYTFQDATSSAPLVINSNPQILVELGGSIWSYGTVDISGGSVSNSGFIGQQDNSPNSQNNLVLAAGSNIQNSGVLQAYGLVQITGASITNNPSGEIAKSNGASTQGFEMLGGILTNSGTVASNLNVITLSGGDIFNSGTIGYNATVNFDGATCSNDANGKIGEISNVFNLLSGVLSNNGEIAKYGSSVTFDGLTLTNYASGDFGNTAGVINLKSGMIQNSGTIGYNASRVIIGGVNLTTNAGSKIAANASNLYIGTSSFTNVLGAELGQSAGTIFLQSAEITNFGKMGDLAGTTILSGASVSNQAGASFVSGTNNNPYSNLQIQSGTLTNNGSVGDQLSQIIMTGGEFYNNAITGHVAKLDVRGGQFNNNGQVITQNLSISGGTFVNSVNIGPFTTLVTSSDAYLDNSGYMALNQATLNGGTISNTGNFESSNFAISAPTKIENRGFWGRAAYGGHTILFYGGSITNYNNFGMNSSLFLMSNGELFNQRTLLGNAYQVVIDGGTLTNSGDMQTIGPITISNGKILNSYLISSASGDISISGGVIENTLSGVIQQALGINISGNASITNAGYFIGPDTYTSSINGGTLLNTGTVANNFNGILTISSGSITNSNSFFRTTALQPFALLVLNGGTITNSGTLGEVAVNISAAASLVGTGDLKVTGNSLIEGTITQGNLFVGQSTAGTLTGSAAFFDTNVTVYAPSSVIGNFQANNLNLAGTIAPGYATPFTSSGTVQINAYGTIAFQDNSLYVVSINGSSSDVINVAPGARATLGSNVNLSIGDDFFNPIYGTTTTYRILNGTYTGGFGNSNPFTNVYGTFHINYAVDGIDLVASIVSAGTLTWQGTNSSLFNDAVNWNPDALPTIGDYLIFDALGQSGNHNVYVIGTGTGKTIDFQTGSDNYTFQGDNLDIDQDIKGIGSQIFASYVQLRPKPSSFITSNGGSFVFANGLGFTDPIISTLVLDGTGTVVNATTSHFAPNVGTVNFSNGQITNYGTFTQSVGNFQMLSGTLNNGVNSSFAGSGTFTLTNGYVNSLGRFGQYASLIFNGGTVVSNVPSLPVGMGENARSILIAGSNVTDVFGGLGFGPFANNVIMTSGTLSIFSPNSLNQAGTIQFMGGSVTSSVSNQYSPARNASITLGGAYFVNTGNFASPGPITRLLLSGGTVYNTGTIGYQAQAVTLDGTCNLITTITSQIAGAASTVRMISGTYTNLGFFADNAGTVQFNGGSLTNSGTVGSNASMTLQGAYISNQGFFGNLARLTLTSGTFVNENVLSARAGGNGTVVINGANVIQNALGQGIANTASSFVLTSGTLSNNGGLVAFSVSGTTQYSGGFVSNNSSNALLSDLASNVVVSGTANISNQGKFLRGVSGIASITGGTINNQSGAQMGPAPLAMFNGSLINHGTVMIDRFVSGSRNAKIAIINGGSITGSGEMWIAIPTSITTPVTQGTLTVGQGPSSPFGTSAQNVTAVLALGSTLNAQVVITGSGLLSGLGTITGSVSSNGIVYPINGSAPATINVQSNVIFTGASPTGLNVRIDGGTASRLAVNGTLSFTGSSVINVANVLNAPAGTTQYVIASFGSYAGSLPNVVTTSSYGNIFSLTKTANQLLLTAAFPQDRQGLVIPTNFGPNARTTAELLIAINGKCLPTTQSIIDFIATLPQALQAEAFVQLSPAFKKAQFALEKLDLLIHKELESALYSEQEGTVPFVITGYDNLDQKPHSYYYGYSVDSYYQLFGVTHDFAKIKWMAAMGAAESYMKVRPLYAKASYNTVYGTLGLSSKHNRWHYGLDGLFGYSFFNGKREIAFLGDMAKTSHGIWNASVDGKLVYDFHARNINFSMYDQVGYIYGHENQYSEYNAPGASLKVKGENISVIRNALGFMFDAPKDSGVKVFLDASWLYERYMNNNTYYGAFSGTDVYGPYVDMLPTQNFARIRTGVMGTHKNLEWKLAYTGLFGKRFSENSGSVKLSYKF